MTTEIIAPEQAPEDEVPGRGLISDAGTFALAMMDDEEFEEKLRTMAKGRDRIARIQRELMIEDVDYGRIPGTPKPTLFKAGAEKLALAYGLAARIESQFYPGDGVTQPPLRYEAQAFLHLRSFDGPIVGVGHGTANSWEKRYRRESKVCPECGQATIMKSKFQPGWYCNPKPGGCGRNFRQDDPRLQNPAATNAKGEPVDQYDLGVTLQKMSEKRAFVDAVLRATASSGLFTQDMVDEPATDEEPQRTITQSGKVVDTSTGEVVDTTGNPDEDHAAADQDVIESRPNRVEGVGRGGVTEGGSSVQLAQIKALSKGLKLGPYGLAKEIDRLGFEIPPLPTDDEREAASIMLKHLDTLTGDQQGQLLQALRKLDDEAREARK